MTIFEHWYRSSGYHIKKFDMITKPLSSNCLTIYSLYNVCSYLPKHWYRGCDYHVKKFNMIANVCSYFTKYWYSGCGYVKKFDLIAKPLISNCLTIYSQYNVHSYLPKHWYRCRGFHVKQFDIITK